MIAHLEKYDTTVDVHDDIGEKSAKDINDNFHSYVDTTPAAGVGQTKAPAAPTSQPAPTTEQGTPSQPKLPEVETEPPPKWQPNFYESVLKNIPLGMIAPEQALINVGETPEARAAAGKAIEGYTWGAAKPLIEPILGQEEKDHPAFADAGSVEENWRLI